MKYLEKYKIFENNKKLEFVFLSIGDFCPICGEEHENCIDEFNILDEKYICPVCNFKWKIIKNQDFDYAAYNNEIIHVGGKIPDEKTNKYTYRTFVSEGEKTCPICGKQDFDSIGTDVNDLEEFGNYIDTVNCDYCEKTWDQYFDVFIVKVISEKDGIEIKKGEKYITNQFNKDIQEMNKNYYLNKDLDKFNI